jgi:hypothetical protein
VNADFASTLNVSTDPPSDGVTLSGGMSQTGEWLLPPGSYQVRVGAASGTGSFTLMSASGAGNTGNVVRFLTVSGTFAQSLGPGDFTFPQIFGDNSFWDVFRVHSPRPCVISAKKTGASDLDLLLVVSNQNGDLLQLDDDSGGGTDPQVSLAQCQTSSGPVTVMVNHYLESGTGPYTLTVTFGQ